MRCVLPKYSVPDILTYSWLKLHLVYKIKLSFLNPMLLHSYKSILEVFPEKSFNYDCILEFSGYLAYILYETYLNLVSSSADKNLRTTGYYIVNYSIF